MSTLNSATLASDDEEDQDFVPVAPKPKRKRPAGTKRTRAERDGSASGSGSSSGSDSDDEGVGELEEGEAKRLKLEQEEAEARKRKEAAKEAYRSLLEGDEPALGKEDKVEPREKVETVEIKRPRQFAGETIYETVSLRKDDPEAIAYLARIAKEGHAVAGTIGSTAAAVSTTQSAEQAPAPTPTPSAAPPVQAAIAPTSKTSTAPLPPKKGPIRRKSRQSLEAMSAALDKGKKMTTLEKSQMDWKSHTSADPSMQSELEANRRGGGFLEKQQFLDRVGDRRTGALEGAKGGARR